MSDIKFDRYSLETKFIHNRMHADDMIIECSLSELHPNKFFSQSQLNTTITLKSLNLNKNEVEALIIILDKIFEKIA